MLVFAVAIIAVLTSQLGWTSQLRGSPTMLKRKVRVHSRLNKAQEIVMLAQLLDVAGGSVLQEAACYSGGGFELGAAPVSSHSARRGRRTQMTSIPAYVESLSR